MSSPLTRMTRMTGLRRRSPRSDARPFGFSRAYDEIAADLPEEDLTEDLTESLELYVMGSKPRCEESEYLEMMQDAIERVARGH